MSKGSFDVVIVGGGIHGCSTALFLAMHSVRALVLERDYSGRHASGVNAGGVRRLGRDLREIPLADTSLKIWRSMSELVDDDCGFKATGHVMVAESEPELQTLRERAQKLAAMGFNHEVLIDQNQLRQLLPAVVDHAVGGLYVAEDGAAMPYQATQAIRRKASQLGADIREGTTVMRIEPDRSAWVVETSDHQLFATGTVVNCAGAWAGEISASLGETVPLVPIAPMLSITAPMPQFVTPVASAAGRVLSFKQFDNGTVLIGGGLTGSVDLARNRAELDFAKLAINAETAIDLFPIMSRARIVRSWAGIEARMPDDIPVLGPSQIHQNLFHSFGYSAHGFQLGPAAGRAIADMILGREPDVDISAFTIGRFGKPKDEHERQN